MFHERGFPYHFEEFTAETSVREERYGFGW